MSDIADAFHAFLDSAHVRRAIFPVRFLVRREPGDILPADWRDAAFLDPTKALRVAARGGRSAYIRILASRPGVDISDFDGLLRSAQSSGSAETLKAVMRLYEWETIRLNIPGLFIDAASKGYTDIVRLLLPRVDQDTKEIGLGYACQFNREETAVFLLDNGVDPNSHEGWPLREAAARNNIPLVELLLARGADPRVRDNMALRYAEIYHHPEIARLLRAHISRLEG